MSQISPASQSRRVAITVRGVVQGVGFRPFVYHAAKAGYLSGWVRNEADTVHIEVQGAPGAVEAFLEALRSGGPPQAQIETLDVRELECQASMADEPFRILPSRQRKSPRPAVPADLATCDACREETHTWGERRYRYPFTNCTNCGPRWSIITHLPYDRPRTSMARFTMCAECQAEYDAPTDRRFHAQPIACPKCGPRLELLDCCGRSLELGNEALERAVREVRAGRILALKGLGGFQLVVDATQPAAVARLRGLQPRPRKPVGRS